MELNRGTIKAQAKELIKGRVFILFLIIFVVNLLMNGISYITSSVSTLPQVLQNGVENFSPDTFQQTTTTSFNFVGFLGLVLAPLTIALSGLFLNVVRGAQYDLGGEFTYVFKNTFDSNYVQKFLLKLLVGIFTGLWSLLFIIPGVIYHYKTYFVDYIMADNPNMEWKETIQLSKKITNGHKGELFMLDLSFILWDILTVITAGIAGIYVSPYVETTKALYYENFKARGLQTGELNETDFLSASQKTAQAYNNNFGNAQQPYQAPAQPPMGQPYQAPAQPQYQPPTEQPYQAPVQPQYQPPTEQPYQAPAQPQYQPPTEQSYQAPAQPFNAPVQEAPIEQPLEAPAEESFYTPPADTQQYFNPENTEDNQQ